MSGAIFFDLDGTLADSLPGLQMSIELAFHSVNRTPPSHDLRPFIGPGIRTILANFDPSLTPEELAAMEQAFRAHYDSEGVLKSLLFEDAAETLRTLKQTGFRLFIVTNKPKLATMRLLDAFALSELFDDAVSRDSRQPAYRSKGEMLIDTMRRNSATTSESWMIGDTVEDQSAAHEAGVRFIHARYGYGTISDTNCAFIARLPELLTHCIPAPSNSESTNS